MAVCKVLTSEKEISEIADAWCGLQKDIGLAPFTDYDWVMAWWHEVGKPSGAKIRVVACYEGAELVGVIPFSIRRKSCVRVLRLVGHEVYYYRNFLVKEPTLMPFIWQTVMDQDGYDCANIKNIHRGTEEDRFLSGRASCNGSSQVYYCDDLGLDRDAFVMRYSRNLRRKVKRVQKAIEEKKNLEIDYCRGEPVPQDVVKFMVHRKKEWAKARRKRGIFDELDPLAFYNKIIKMTAESGSLLLYWMRLEGEVVGVVFSVIEKGIVYGHTLAFDHKAKAYTPGITLFMESLLWSSENGMVENNFMEGEEDYKTRFSKTSRTIYEYSFSRNLLGKVYLWLYMFVSYVRKIKNKE